VTVSNLYISAIFYVAGTALPSGSDPYVGQASKAGAVVTIPATVSVPPGTKNTYLNTATVTANTTNAGSEIEIPLSALGGTAIMASSRFDLLAAYTCADSVSYSGPIPQVSGRTTSLCTDPNFTTIAGTQVVAFVLGSGMLTLRSETATAFNFSMYPNPAQGAATIAYRVLAGSRFRLPCTIR